MINFFKKNLVLMDKTIKINMKKSKIYLAKVIRKSAALFNYFII